MWTTLFPQSRPSKSSPPRRTQEEASTTTRHSRCRESLEAQTEPRRRSQGHVHRTHTGKTRELSLNTNNYNSRQNFKPLQSMPTPPNFNSRKRQTKAFNTTKTLGPVRYSHAELIVCLFYCRRAASRTCRATGAYGGASLRIQRRVASPTPDGNVISASICSCTNLNE